MIYNNSQDLLLEIRKIMLEKNISIKELAIRMNKTPSSVSSLLKQTNISYNAFKEICDALNVVCDINFSNK